MKINRPGKRSYTSISCKGLCAKEEWPLVQTTMTNLRPFVFMTWLFLLGACNVYRPLAAPRTTADYIQEAQRCLEDGNFDCALSNYGQLPAGNDKTEKLCMVNLSKAGLSLDALLSIAVDQSTGSQLLADLADALLPYSSAKETAANAAAQTYCNALTASQTAYLLQGLAYLTDCAIRMAHTDTAVTDADVAGSSCDSSIAGNGDGKITKVDIGPSGGALSSGNTGMCKYDVDICVTDIANAETAAGNLGTSLAGLASNIGTLTGIAGATDVARDAIRGLVPAP